MANYKKLQEEDQTIHDELEKLDDAFDSHTDENQSKRKTLRDHRASIQQALEAIGKSVEQGQKAITGLYQSIEASLELAKHAKTWSWKERNGEKLS